MNLGNEAAHWKSADGRWRLIGQRCGNGCLHTSRYRECLFEVPSMVLGCCIEGCASPSEDSPGAASWRYCHLASPQSSVSLCLSYQIVEYLRHATRVPSMLLHHRPYHGADRAQGTSACPRCNLRGVTVMRRVMPADGFCTISELHYREPRASHCRYRWECHRWWRYSWPNSHHGSYIHWRVEHAHTVYNEVVTIEFRIQRLALKFP